MTNDETVLAMDKLAGEWKALYERKKAEADRWFDCLATLAADRRVDFVVRDEILKEMERGLGK